MTTRVKYPRTLHVPWSESETSDDVWLEDPLTIFNGKEVVVTSKMDGENCTMYRDGLHARSLDSAHHPSRSVVKQLQATIAPLIPEGMRICGENLYAYHSIYYANLPSHFLVFSIFDDDTCLAWDETVTWCEQLGLHTVPVIYRGPWNEKLIKTQYGELYAWEQMMGRNETYEAIDPNKKDIRFPDDFKPCTAEGYVVRNAASFHIEEFHQNTAKWVRKNHVKGNVFWMDRKPIPNGLKNP